VNAGKALAGTALVASLLAALGAATATPRPGAMLARPANTLIATPTLIEAGGSNVDVGIRGQVQSASHKFAPRRCRAERTLDITSPSISGRILELGSTYPTTKAGRFNTSFPVEYGFTDEEGLTHEGSVPLSGGTATFTLSTGKLKVQKVKGDPFRTYTCRPLSLTVQLAIPAAPGG
jgi:hypothetical protein